MAAEPKQTDWVSNHDDALSVHSRSESEEDENLFEPHEVMENDRALLQEEEEREKLLSSGGAGVAHDGRRTRRKHRRPKKSRRGKKIESMYELEEGALKDDASSHASSSSLKLDLIKAELRPISKRRKAILYTSISLTIAALFFLFTFGAFKASHTSPKKPTPSLLSNGSTNFGPTTILISLDGFRADFLHRGITPTLNAFISEGVSPKYMLPSFPSVTFPNHYTLVTGLYPESHGVVGNTFWDPELKAEFYYTDPARSMHPKWWQGGEPLWVTAEKQNIKTAIHMWPGSEAHLQPEPTFLDSYNGDEPLSEKVDRILGLLDIPNSGENSDIIQRPQLIAAYVPVVDADGHKYGPNSTEIQKTIAGVDAMLQDIFTGLDQRNLTKIVNIVVVSDHGMATTSVDRLIQLDDLIDLSLVEHMDGWPLYGLRPKNPSDLQGLYDTLQAESVQNPNFDVYLRDENMPERYHFSQNERIAPLWVVPKTGWAIVHKEDFDVKEAKAKNQTYNPKGLHGYDHEHPLMRAIFVARGPAFPHPPNSKLDVFQNTEVYNIVCDSLAIDPISNNGTLRLPLVPIGLHPDLPDTDETLSQASDADLELSATTTTTIATTTSPLHATVSPTNPPAATPTTNISNATDAAVADPKDGSENQSLWDFLVSKLEAAKSWVEGLIASETKDKEPSEDSNG